MSKKEVLAVDLDDNLTTFDGPFRIPWVYENTGKLLLNPEEGEFAYEKAYKDKGLTTERVQQLIDGFLASDKSLKWITPYPGAKEVMAELSERYEIHIITARPAIHRQMTERLIQMHFDGYVEELHMPNNNGDHISANKATVCRAIGATALIDDADHNINQVMYGADTQGILVKYKGQRHNGGPDLHPDAIIIPNLMTVVKLDEFRQEHKRWPDQSEVESLLAGSTDP